MKNQMLLFLLLPIITTIIFSWKNTAQNIMDKVDLKISFPIFDLPYQTSFNADTLVIAFYDTIIT